MYVPHLPALLRARLPFFLFFLPFLALFMAFFLAFFLATVWARLSVPGCELGPSVAACSSGSGEKAMAIASARAVMRVFLIRISKYLPFEESAVPQATTAGTSAPARVRQRVAETRQR